MEWMFDLNIWVGLLTLIVLEIVLGIDNLIFIAILANKLPANQREQARVLGLSFALIMRLAMLSGLSWLFTLTTPWISVAGIDFSGRDVILILGGFFLVLKATTELHERIEGTPFSSGGDIANASFWVIVTQIIVLDAVFSIDSVITAIGMVKQLPVMIAAVTIAMLVMLFASRAITKFISEHPTIIVLCLGFLLMIGFALIADGFGYEVPKGYLYSAIVFSIVIESLNQLARSNLIKLEARRPMRERTAEGILRLLGKSVHSSHTNDNTQNITDSTDYEQAFGVQERNMVSGVLQLAERSIHSVMTPRSDISWININDAPQNIKEVINDTPHGFFPVCNDNLDNIIGIGRAKDMMANLLQDNKINQSVLRAPIMVHETVRILDLMDTLKAARGQLVIVLDEFGAVEGLVTPMDLFEAIAGDFPDEDETPDIIQRSENSWVIDGSTDLIHLEQTLDVNGLRNDEEDFSTLAGFLLHRFGQLPQTGDNINFVTSDIEFNFKVLELDNRRISKVLVTQLSSRTLQS